MSFSHVVLLSSQGENEMGLSERTERRTHHFSRRTPRKYQGCAVAVLAKDTICMHTTTERQRQPPHPLHPPKAPLCLCVPHCLLQRSAIMMLSATAPASKRTAPEAKGAKRGGGPRDLRRPTRTGETSSGDAACCFEGAPAAAGGGSLRLARAPWSLPSQRLCSTTTRRSLSSCAGPLITRGEEEEEKVQKKEREVAQLFSQRCILYQLRKNNRIERGLGVVKLLKVRDKVKFVMQHLEKRLLVADVWVEDDFPHRELVREVVGRGWPSTGQTCRIGHRPSGSGPRSIR